MKVGLFSDLHAHNYPAFARIGRRGVTSRLDELMTSARVFVETCAQAGCDYVIHNGDWFDQKNRPESVVIAESLALLAAYPTVSFVFNHGNHEEAAGGLRSTLEVFAGQPNVQCVSHDALLLLEDACLIPHTRDRATLLALLDAARDSCPDDGLLLLHAQIDGARTSSEFRIPGTVTVAEIGSGPWRAVYGGHIHEPQLLELGVIIIGSVAQRSFSDEGATRRGFIVDTTTATCTEVPIPGPRFRTVDVRDPDDLAVLVPPAGAHATAWYQRVRVHTPEVTPAEIGALLDDVCAGYAIQSVVPTAASPVAVGGLLDADWHATVRAWVAREEHDAATLPLLLDVLDHCIEGDAPWPPPAP